MIRETKIKLFVALISFILISSAFSAKAIEYGQIGGKPTNFDPNVPDSKSWFIYKLEPGASKEDSLTVSNLFADQWDALIYAADSVKSSSGGFALKQISEDKTEVGSWVKFYPDSKPDYTDKIFEGDKKIFEACTISTDDLTKNYKLTADQINDFGQWCKGKTDVDLTMKAGAKVDLPFVISIPQNAEVGEHTGGILIQKQNKDETAQADGSKVLLTTRVGVRIYETVPGEIIKKLSFANFSVAKNFDEFYLPWNKEKRDKFGEYVITSTVQNSGNVSADFKEKIIIKNLITGNTESIDDREFQVLRGDNFTSTLAWKSPRIAFLSFQKEYTYKDANGSDQTVVSETISRWFIPWREMVMTLILLLIILAGYLAWKNWWKKYYGGIGWVSYTIKKGDTVMALSSEFNVNWKKLTRTNRIKAPYLLEVGQIIKVPNNKKVIESEVAEIKEKVTVKEEKAVQKKNQKVVAKAAPKQTKTAVKKSPIIVLEKSKIAKKIVLCILVLAGVCLVIAAALVLIRDMNKKDTISASTASINSLAINENNSNVVSDENANKPAEESVVKEVQKIDPLQMKIEVLNGGAVSGTAGKIKDFLMSKEYKNVEANNAIASTNIGTAIYYTDENLKNEAQWIGKLLESKQIQSGVKMASTDEEKSGDVVIILGK